MLNILHTESSNGWGGQEIRILKEAEGMRTRGHNIIFCIVKGGQLVKKARAKNFLVYEIPFFTKWNAFWLIFALTFIILKHKIDIINTHSSTDSWVGGIAARFCKKKVIRTRHLSTPVKDGLNSRILYNYLTDFMITTSSCIIPQICKQSGLSLNKCRCIATGVDPSTMEINPKRIEELKSTYGITNEDFVIGTVCVLRCWKGISDILQSANLLRDVKNLKWLIVGGGDVEKYKQMAEKLNLSGIVFFTNHLDDPQNAIHIMNIFMLLSTASEGISQAVLQAGFLKKPLITTNVGGLPEVCLDNENGFVVPPQSPDAVVEKIKILMGNQSLRSSMGLKSNQLINDHFLIKNTLDATQECYNSL